MIFLLLASCANRTQGPTGGPKDEVPPKVIKASPENGELNYRKTEMSVYFDENIKLDKVQDNVVVSPVQLSPPEIKANGKLLTVKFLEDLKDSTTYSVHFGDAVVDLNEGNAISNFHMAFSTGNQIDSLGFSGNLLNAETLEAMPKIIIGVHSDTTDTAVSKKPFDRISRTDDLGRFYIENLKPGKYKVYALGDLNRNYKFDPGEDAGFVDSIIHPYFTRELRPDTIWKDTTHVDTVLMHERTILYPQNILLKYFKSAPKIQRLVKSERIEDYLLRITFNMPHDSAQNIVPLNFDQSWKENFSQHRDTLDFWLKDTAQWNMDTLSMAVGHFYTDTLSQLSYKTDTVHFVKKRKVIAKTKTKIQVKEKLQSLTMTSSLSTTMDLNKPLDIEFSEPLDTILLDSIRFIEIKDSLRVPLPFHIIRRDSIGMKYRIIAELKPKMSYELNMDSAIFRSILGRVNNREKFTIKMKSPEDYSTFKLKISPFDSLGVVQLMNSKEKILVQQNADEKLNIFEYLKAEDIYIRMFIDLNQNGKWDTGDLTNRIQPENMYYFTRKVTLKANWEIEETWNPLTVPILNQRPAELRKELKSKKKPASSKNNQTSGNNSQINNRSNSSTGGFGASSRNNTGF